jgi:hypothetical protein
MKRRTEITVEEQIRIVRRAGVSPQVSCPECGGEVWMLMPEDAALAAGVSSRTIYRWVEQDKIHFRESASGTLVVCPRSVLEQARTA